MPPSYRQTNSSRYTVNGRGGERVQIGCNPETLRGWVRQTERDQGRRPDDGRTGADQGAGAQGPGAAPGERDPSQGIGVFRPGGARPPVQERSPSSTSSAPSTGSSRSAKSDACVALIAPSTCHSNAARRTDPSRTRVRWQSDAEISVAIPGSP